VGESSRLETAITVTGLKPGHFYNVRVIAVGSNNFQAGSGVIRLRTYGRDGRPQLANSRMPPNLSIEDQHNGSDSGDESQGARGQVIGVEAAAAPEGAQVMARESSGPHPAPRRNTGGRRHSPSNTAVDHSALANNVSNQPEESMQQLTERFEAIRREIEELTAQISKDAEEFKSQMLDLMKERDEKRQALKEKEEASEKLKKEVHYSERANRQAQNRKTQKEKILRDKQAERAKMQDDMVRWKKEIEDMKAERELWNEEREKLNAAKEARAEELRATIRKRQNSLNGLEEEIRVKGLQIKELEEERKHLPGGQDDEESRERDAAEAQSNIEWELKERELTTQLHNQSLHLRQLQAEFHGQQALFAAISARQANNPLMYQGSSSALELDPVGGQVKAKSRRSRNRKSRTSTISSPIAGYPITDSPFPSASAYNNLNGASCSAFAPGPYFDLSNDTAMVPLSEQNSGMSDVDLRAFTVGAPLSPTATALLPSNIFSDDDPPSPRAESSGSFGPALHGNQASTNHDNDPQSPGSSSRSASIMSSPRESSHAVFGVSGREHASENDRRSTNSPRTDYGAIGSPSGSDRAPAHKGFGNIFGFPRARGKTTVQDDGPALGSLKQGQSQSFPRSTEEAEAIANRPRRISFSSGWNVMPSFLSRNSPAGELSTGNAPAPARNAAARRRRGFNMFSSSIDDPATLFSDRDPGSPRPVSTASSDLPRPSTDSAPFGWPAADGNVMNRNSPLATNWSINVSQAWSRNPSRRTSMQHGSSSALTGGIASDDDEFLPPDTLACQSSPPPVGVIGTRPPSSHKPITPKLNPAAPTFKAMFSRTSKADKAKAKEKAAEVPAPSEERPQTAETSSPTESRKSRDTRSIHTQNSMAESHESLERISSNTPSDLAIPAVSGGKDKESSLRQLLRKGSSSKFSLSSIRGKDSALFGGRKGGSSSAANSDHNAAVERDGSIDEYSEDALGRSVESVTSSSMIGSLGSSAEGKGKEKEKEAGTTTTTPKEGRINWGRFGLKKDRTKGGRESVDLRESLDVDRSEAETTDDGAM